MAHTARASQGATHNMFVSRNLIKEGRIVMKSLKSLMMSALMAATLVTLAAPAFAQDAASPAPTGSGSADPTPPPAPPAPAPKADGSATATWSFATGQSKLFPVKSWPELVKLVQFVDRWYYVEMQKSYVEEQAKPSLSAIGSGSTAQETLTNFFVGLGFVLNATGDQVPADTKKAFLGYMATEGCTRTVDKKVTGLDGKEKTIKVWTPQCYDLYKQVAGVFGDRVKFAPAGSSKTIAQKIMATAAEYAETEQGTPIPGQGGDAVILAHGALAALMPQLPADQRPWKLSDGDGSGGGGTYDNSGFSVHAGAGYTRVFARDDLTNGNIVTAQVGVEYKLSVPLAFTADVGLMHLSNGGMAPHYTETTGAHNPMFLAVGVAFVPRLSDLVGLRIHPKGLVMSNGGKGAVADIGPSFFLGSERKLRLDVVGQVGYIDWSEATGDNKTAPRIADPKFRGPTAGAFFNLAYQW